MRLIAFQIKNYKSIKDTGLCYLSDLDPITALAGQNESGKSSVLQAIYDFESGTLRSDAQRVLDDDEVYPEVTCIFEFEDGDAEHLLAEESADDTNTAKLYGELKASLLKKKRLTLKRVFSSQVPSMTFEENDAQNLEQILEKYRSVVAAENAAQPTPAITTPQVAGTLTEPAVAEPAAPKPEQLPTTSVIVSKVHKYTPVIVIFDDRQDLLPPSILVSDLNKKKETVQGYQAVMNLQKAFGLDLEALDASGSLPKRLKQAENYNQQVTADFREYWTQKIHGDNKVTLEIMHREGSGKGASFEFYVLTRDQERLYPAQRSRGFQWYLSFYLELKAQSKKHSQGLVILFDEPGLYLHATAQANIKLLFEELTRNACQIVYSTHSPYLIDVDKLNRLRLVINDGKDGTLVEKVTSERLKGKKLDSLKPIIDAMGMEVATYLTPISKKNVIVEGISDFYYFCAFKKLLGRDGNYSFLPSQGAQNSHLLMELCIGWNIDWLLVFDDDKESQEAQKKIRKQFGNENVDDKIYTLRGFAGIENIFQLTDLKRIDPKITAVPGGDNSKFINENAGGKELFARLFLDKVNSGAIDASKLTKSCIEEYGKVFDAIEKRFKS
jgi:predicted ATP-dependent endonuclease of OLD family